jgi:hypothetical protein
VNPSSRSRMALKPFLDTVISFCASSSKDELADVVVALAKEVSVSERSEFISRIESYSHTPGSPEGTNADRVEVLLDAIEALDQSVTERIESIEDGTYCEVDGKWDDDYRFDEEPYYFADEQFDQLACLITEADKLFVDDRLEEAREVFQALFTLIDGIEEVAVVLPRHESRTETDFREARARYCRCIYETLEGRAAVDSFMSAMAPGAHVAGIEDLSDECYPMIQDVIDAKPGEMKDLDSFLLSWKGELLKTELGGRRAELVLETVFRLEGMEGVAGLARAWKDRQPRGFVFWVRQLKRQGTWEDVNRVGMEGLDALPEGGFREWVALSMVEAGRAMNDPTIVLRGKRERFYSCVCDHNLLDFLEEAERQEARESELGAAIEFMRKRNDRKERYGEEALFLKALLAAGELESAFEEVRKEKSIGWSSGDSGAGVVFGSALSVAAGHSGEAVTIRTVLEEYADREFAYSMSVLWVDNQKPAVGFCKEILRGLEQAGCPERERTKYFDWAKKIGKDRIDNIVSSKHRKAYRRAAEVLCALAEAYVVMGAKDKAVDLVNVFCSEKYGRHSAFRKEVRHVIGSSRLLKQIPLRA